MARKLIGKLEKKKPIISPFYTFLALNTFLKMSDAAARSPHSQQLSPYLSLLKKPLLQKQVLGSTEVTKDTKTKKTKFTVNKGNYLDFLKALLSNTMRRDTKLQSRVSSHEKSSQRRVHPRVGTETSMLGVLKFFLNFIKKN